MAERNILKMIDHPFLINLHWAFKSNDYLHMVLDYCPGGEFFYHLSRNGKLDEEIARFYFCEVLLALEYLHNNGVIYRDLKPENILLDIEGHVVLTDFGLSKTNFTRDTLSHSFCGSPEYMSPEMLEEIGHGFSIDIYSLGALLYEFLTGLPPHYSQDRNELFHNICNNKLTLPDYLSFEAKDLLKRLLKKNPNERLGAIDGIGEIKFHPFCETIDFDALAEKRYVPPFIPEKDEFYFDTDYLKTQIEENPENYFPINDILKNESKESVNHEILLDRHTITELNEFPEGLYGEKQSGSINVSLQESTYKGYSFYKAASETSESCDCSLVSTQYKISDRINDLNTSKLTKETQFELPKEEISSKEPKFMSSQYSSNDFDIDETKNDPFEEEIFVEETTERVNISTEPEILKPHIGNNTKTKRQRNLEEYCIDKSETQNMETESDFIDEFLESFDTELQDIQENESFNDIEEHEDDHDLKLQYYSSYLSSKMENYSSFNNKKASVNFIQKEKALTSVKPPQKKIKVNHTLTRNQNSFCEKLVQISQHKESEDNSIINFDSLKRPCKEVNLKKYASARISCERIPPKKNIIKKQNMCLVNTTKQVENRSKTSRDTQNRTFKLPPRSGHFNNSSTSYLHKQKFLSRDNFFNDSKSYNRINSQLGFNRTTRMSKNPKLMAEAEEKRNTNSYIRNLSCNKSIGGEVRESNPTKTMTNMKLSFESNNWPGTMMDFMNSKISQNSPFDPCSSIDSDVIVKTEHLRKPLSHSKAQIKKPQNQQRDSYAPLRTVDHRRGSKTPMLEAKIANSSIDRTIDSRMQDSFLTSTLKLANMHLNKKLADTSDRDSSMIDRSRNSNIKYSTYSEQASIAKLNRLNIDHESKSFSSRIKTKHQNNQFVFEKSNKTNTLTASVVNSTMDNRYGRYSHIGEDSRSHCARSKPKFDNVERKSVLNASKNTKIIQNFSSSNLIKKSKPTFSRKKGSYIQKHDNPLSRAQSTRGSQPYEYEVRNITLNCESGFESKPSLKRTKDSLGSFIDETKMSSCYTKPSYSSSRSKIIPKRGSDHPNTHSKLAGIGNYKRRQAHF